jgi:uncharacterized protein YbjT (DUF2867 family)
MYLITGAGGGVGSVSRRVVDFLRDKDAPVRAMVHHDDGRADVLREAGAEVVAGDLTNPQDVVDAMRGATRVFFSMSVSPDYLTATSIVCAAGRELGGIELIVNMSQMTVSQMTLTSSEESEQQRLHWLSEQIMNWSGLPVAHIRPTVFLDNPLFTVLARQSVRDRDVLALPFGTGHTSPIAADDVARVVAALLEDPTGRAGKVYELTGPQVLDLQDLAEQYSQALGRPITAEDMPFDDFLRQLHGLGALPEHVQHHIETMARLHREDRYNRATDDVEQVTGEPAHSVAQSVAANRDQFA